MMGRERTVVGGLLLILLVLWLGFVWHRSPRFPGSFTGSTLGIAAAVLMLIPLGYALVKRIDWLKKKIGAQGRLARLLTWHIYAGIVASVLAILHSGHRFESWLGIVFTASMLLSVASGYIGRHFLRYLSLDLKERQESLVALQGRYAQLAGKISSLSQSPAPRNFSFLRYRLAQIVAGRVAGDTPDALLEQAIEFTTAIADTEYAIQANEIIKNRLHKWLVAHIAASVVFYLLLALHIAAAIEYGLRWLS